MADFRTALEIPSQIGMRTWIRILIILIATVSGTNCTKNTEGGESEMYEGIVETIRELDSEDYAGIDSFAQRIRTKSWKNPMELVNILHADEDDESSKAALVLVRIGDLAMTPLLDSISRDNPEGLVWDMNTVVSIQLDNRSRIVKVLDEMLTDKRYLDLPSPPPDVEEIPPSRRVCDEAYIMTRLLFALEEDEAQLLDNTDVFLDMSDEERDAEIERARKTKKWISLVDRMLEEEDFE